MPATNQLMPNATKQVTSTQNKDASSMLVSSLYSQATITASTIATAEHK
ncbi:hypothetical protein RS130_09400 [Paraglaciecola aquimarina]|uniref:RebB protein n=1 Tax=Paraglaciecola aquimarina TaxID=1235557 RepID=A0ABU3SVW0_9ALTE|nr:hypothetical protein [Paraglaciecola aquimarina]MDU0354122.1 hypothetical protein [Paraglaciecola aquimarina]